ncbi:hypothetical protein LCGC14_3018120 [marine sediment metagenome]|uniref:Uncharacterized protein n=1 Tax=marine sediment metagenome TaxID=412755 RepID=A0A0F8Z3R7_9ZZZZ
MLTEVQKRLVEGMRKLYPDAPIIRVKMLYEKEVRDYVMKTEEAHKRAAKSTLRFRSLSVTREGG